MCLALYRIAFDCAFMSMEPDQRSLSIQTEIWPQNAVVTNNKTSTWHHQFIETILAGCQKEKTNIIQIYKIYILSIWIN